ncbi:MAG: hypothetical protein GY749_50655 [Desulfobacteraceae bacterium]|nr:hypothetical protein [Desulfobacteraceae bacterium]
MGRVKRITYPDKEEVYYHYDSDGRLNEVSGYAYGMAWNANGQLKSVSFSNNTSTSFEYDNDRLWLDSATATGPAGVLYDAEYDYDDAARVLSVASGTNSLLNLGFGYDDLNRLTDVSGSQNQSFAYDSRGNITSVQYGYSVPAEATNASYSYDVNGNMEEDGFRVYTWDYENRLTSIKKDNLTTTFLYDSDGTRIKKSGPRGTVRYFGGLAELVDGSLVKYYYAGPILIARQDATGKYWYHSDHLGSVRLITDEQGQKVNTYDYAAFGHTISESGSLNNEHNFTGHRRDPETGLIYMGSRYYNTLLGRFISADTIVPDPTNPQALNRYAYAYNNPISNVDPTGHAPVAVAVISAATVIGAWSAGTVSGIVAATAVIGAGVTIAGYFAKDPVLSTIGSVMLGFAGGYMMPGALVGQVASGLIGASVSGLTSPLSPLDPDVKEVIGWAYTAYGLIMAANEGATKQLPGDNSDFGNLIKEAAPSFAKGEKPPNWEQIVAFCEMSQADEIEFINNIINKKIYKGWETVNPEFWGSGVQQLFGQRIAERAGVNKWLAILKNPSGGLVGPGFGKWWFPAWYDKGFMGVHGAIHDADAILLKDYNIGWGYANWPHPGLFPSVPQSGQIGGLSVQLISNSFQYYFGL